jgi:hypothetical protein
MKLKEEEVKNDSSGLDQGCSSSGGVLEVLSSNPSTTKKKKTLPVLICRTGWLFTKLFTEKGNSETRQVL